ncbi:MAG: DUF2891 domain-containing protein [Leeuwenhoekiella sp.]
MLIAVVSCDTSSEKNHTPEDKVKKKLDSVQYSTPDLSLQQANNLAKLPLNCVETEYPNKLGQTLGSAEDLGKPAALHPAFYGCFDWHSAVHGHWSMIYLLKTFPEIDEAETFENLLKRHLTSENIQAEINYFKGEHNSSYERTYGWAWLLKLAEELHTWDDPLARELEENLQPLTDLLVEKYKDFLPKLNYPIRVGTHTNTAFGMSFAYEYAETVNDTSFRDLLAKRAKDFFLNDQDCPMEWEPGGNDFLSPCLEELNIMRLVLPKEEFLSWAEAFLPKLKDENYALAVGEVSDRTDGQLVHLDGVNFSRAWNLYALAQQFPQYGHLKNQADMHLSYSLPNVVGDDYEGGHWLGSFALYALNTSRN